MQKIPVTLNTDTRYLPTCWEEVTFDQFLNIARLDAEEGLSGTDKATRIVSILTGYPVELLEEAGFGVVIPLFSHLEFLKTAPELIPTDSVTILGTEYYARPIETMGELAAFDKITTAFPDDVNAQMPYLMALLLRKKRKTAEKQDNIGWFGRLLGRKTEVTQAEDVYEQAENSMDWIESRAKLFRQHLNPCQVKALEGFFLDKSEAFKLVTQHYSKLTRIQPLLNGLSDSISAQRTAGWRPSTIWNRMFSNILRCYLRLLQMSLRYSSTGKK
ncbi:hypothetical protein [Solirubrum puertoriconensis]|uniref:Uncharacterized protein n=1 Tax=Solirubrum puertoriconensis TaxID=1751427 RepID=A0A9X0HKE8_SOLP1|nr:hypothetical protein [Solirubrum puertoriconensis]KUG07431.1 hypothetical protein ASU33_13845 [Solirubrum puertoriconensis]